MMSLQLPPLLMPILLPCRVFAFLFFTSSLVSALVTTQSRRSRHSSHNNNIITTVPSQQPHNKTTPLHKIHTTYDWLTPEEAHQCLHYAYTHARETGCWSAPDDVRHVNYGTCDFAVEDAPLLAQYLESLHFYETVLADLREWFAISSTTTLEFLDLFCAHYQAKPSTSDTRDKVDNPTAVPESSMDQLEPHRDGSLLSFTITLTPPTEFTGGGTSFDCLLQGRAALSPAKAGGAVVHVGKLLHGAAPVLSGTRTVLVGFVNVIPHGSPPRILQPSPLALACREWGRLDVATKLRSRFEQQEIVYSASDKWLPHSCLRGVLCPELRAVKRRASQSFQRHNRLVTEDVLLQSLEL